jgi:hypothetical protein
MRSDKLTDQDAAQWLAIASLIEWTRPTIADQGAKVKAERMVQIIRDALAQDRALTSEDFDELGGDAEALLTRVKEHRAAAAAAAPPDDELEESRGRTRKKRRR